jgi:DNA polymerase-1
MKIRGLGIPPVDYTVSGMPAADSPVIKILAGDPEKGKYGKAYDHFVSIGKEQEGKECCEALSNWLKFKSIETLLVTYLIPLQRAPDSKGRIHCSMNLNTETGRLSCRKPNLQNQPALDKDKYKIRKAFVAEKGNKLIVADYGQLELRVLAHMTNCKGMIDAFKLGGDFHSRTALVRNIYR